MCVTGNDHWCFKEKVRVILHRDERRDAHMDAGDCPCGSTFSRLVWCLVSVLRQICGNVPLIAELFLPDEITFKKRSIVKHSDEWIPTHTGVFFFYTMQLSFGQCGEFVWPLRTCCKSYVRKSFAALENSKLRRFLIKMTKICWTAVNHIFSFVSVFISQWITGEIRYTWVQVNNGEICVCEQVTIKMDCLVFP